MMTRPRKTRRVLVYDASPGGGGACTSIAALAEPCAAAGIELVVAARVPSAFAQLAPGVEVVAMPVDDLGAVHGLAYAKREYSRAQALWKLARRLRVGALLANNAPSTNAAAYLAAAQLSLPVVQYVRAQLSLTRLTHALLRRASAVLAVGRATVEQLLPIVPGRTVRVLEGLSGAQLPTPRSHDARGFFWSSALVQWKGLSLLLDGYARAATHQALPPLHVCYLNIAPQHADTAALPTHLPANVHLHCAPQNLDSLRRGCNVYVHTALVPEPFGRSILEAMAAGLCPVVTDEGSGPELVTHMRDGLIVRARDASALARALQRLAEQPELASRLGAAAASKARAFGAAQIYAPVIQALAQSFDAGLRHAA